MGQLIQRVCDEIIRGELDCEFPLHVFQTGSGTHSNMNVNEVIANRCIQLAGGTLGSQQPVHPNDHVNMAQSSNDTFPTAMHIAAYTMATGRTIPALRRLRDAIAGNAEKWAGVVKIGRTHLEDATPLTVGQEWSGYAGALDDAIAEVERVTHGLLELAMGGTAVGTGLNAPRRLRRGGRRGDRRDDRRSLRDRGQQVHGPGHPGPDGARARGPQGRGREPVQDRQ